MKHNRLALSALLSLGMLTLSSQAALADLSGDLRITVKDKGEEQQVQGGKIYMQGSADDKERNVRVEIDADEKAGEAASDAVIISRPAENVGYMVFPGMKSYMKMDIESARDKGPNTPGGEGLDPDDFKKIGEEKVGGYDTVVKEAPVLENGKKLGTVTVYLAKDLNDEPLKSVFREEGGRVTETLIENPTTNKLPDDLFTPPAGYSETVLPQIDQLQEELRKEQERAADEAAKEARDNARKEAERSLRDSLPF